MDQANKLMGQNVHLPAINSGTRNETNQSSSPHKLHA
jgi:hypothetical protein